MAAALAIAPERLAIPYQVHSPDVVAISAPFPPDARPRCDALVTATPGLGLGVTGADCGMILFADPEARVDRRRARRLERRAHRRDRSDGRGDGAARGAAPSACSAALGPCIAQASYEVGPEFVAAFAAGDNASSARFFMPSRNAERAMFDLHAYIAERARARRRRPLRGSRPRHLRRRSALLQLSPRHPPQGARLRPAGGGDRAGLSAARLRRRLTARAAAAPPVPSARRPHHLPAARSSQARRERTVHAGRERWRGASRVSGFITAGSCWRSPSRPLRRRPPARWPCPAC